MTRVELRGVTWDHERGLGGLRATADAYAEVRPDVGVEWTVRSLQAFADQAVDALAERFDLIYLDHPAIGYATARSCLVPLDEHMDGTFLEDHAANSVGRSVESYRWEGHQWALATDVAAQVAAYRPDLLERAGVRLPRTWGDVALAADELRRHDLWVALPAIPVDAMCAFLAICVAHGEELFAGEERVVGREAGREALEAMRRVVGASHPESMSWNPPRMLEHMSTQDDVAYCPLAFGYSNYARPGFRSRLVRFTGGPAGDDGLPRGTLGGAGLAVSGHSPAIDEAVAYARFVAEPQIQRTVYVEGGGQPGHRSAWTEPSVNRASSGFFLDTLAALDAAYLRPRYDGFLRFQDAGGETLHAWLLDGGPAEADAVLDALDARYRESLPARHLTGA